jgi:hypothetical protein
VRLGCWLIVAVLRFPGSNENNDGLDSYSSYGCVVSALLLPSSSSSSSRRRRTQSSQRTARNTLPVSLASSIPDDPPSPSMMSWPSSQSESLREWETDFAALVAFQKRHGHLTIPLTEPRLYRFVKNMRQNYKYLEQQQQQEDQEQVDEQHDDHFGYDRFTLPSPSSSFPTTTTTPGIPSSTAPSSGLPSRRHALTPERTRRLESIGFTWTPRQDIWNDKYDQLHQFWKEHGHTDLPPADPEFKDLRRWMTYQRIRYRSNYEEKQPRQQGSSKKPPIAPLTLEQVQLLGRIQFSWTPHDETWWKKFRQLESFHRRSGNFEIKGRENHKLRCWKNTLRRQCREYVMTATLEGTTDGVHVSGLNTERLEALRRIRFCWLPPAPALENGVSVMDEHPPEDIFRGYQ